MSRQKFKQQRQALSRFLLYVLGHRPDEFGLVPDEQGFIPLKELLMAVKEEEGWSFVREGHISELLREPDRTGFEVRDKMIRVRPKDSALVSGPPEIVSPPALLYHAARRKAYPAILERGLKPGARPSVPLFTNMELSLRVGRRRDPQPVPLTIHTAKAEARGVIFTRLQELIYLVESLAPEFLTGPPLPKERPAEEKKKKTSKSEPPKPGSFLLDPNRDPDLGRRPERTKKDKAKDWKRASRKMRRGREKP
ncbi:MAG: RNA 2'-phosphotransferase [Thermodesulfobacteriota bacterium]|nr:RNA 2'-phosphotransferase [Thermodesulfobacteriota bacterium]